MSAKLKFPLNWTWDNCMNVHVGQEAGFFILSHDSNTKAIKTITELKILIYLGRRQLLLCEFYRFACLNQKQLINFSL